MCIKKQLLLLLIAATVMASCKKSGKPDGAKETENKGPVKNQLIFEKTVNILCNGDFSIPWQVANVGGYNYEPVLNGLPSYPTTLKNFNPDLGTQGFEVETDATGSVFTLGRYDRRTDFDPGPDSVFLDTRGFYLQKLDAEGNLLWVKDVKIRSVHGGDPYIQNRNIDIETDAAGNVFVIGYTAADGLTHINGKQYSIIKYDSNGEEVWKKSFYAANYSIDYNSIAIDGSGNIYFSGWFAGTVDFDPGAGVFELTSVTAYASNFLLKLDNSGNLVWAKRLNHTIAGISFAKLAVDPVGNIYLTGILQGHGLFDFGGLVGVININGNSGMFLAKYDTSGEVIWVNIEPIVPNGGDYILDNNSTIVADANGNIYLSGKYSSVNDYTNGATSFTSSTAYPYHDFIAMYNANGTLNWARSIDGYNRGLSIDGAGNIYTVGHTYDHERTVLQKFSATGQPLWSNNTYDFLGSSIVVSPVNGFYISGYFLNVPFNSVDTFTAKIQDCN